MSRRGFLGGVGGLAAAACAGGAAIVLEPMIGSTGTRLEAQELGPLTPEQRAQRAFEIRVDAAAAARDVPIPAHQANGDEDRFPHRIGNFSKGLPHDDHGEVSADAYDALLFALASGRPQAFEDIPLGYADPSRQRPLVNPQAGLAFDLEGTDSHQLTVPPAPAFGSAEAAGEAVELYWTVPAQADRFRRRASGPEDADPPSGNRPHDRLRRVAGDAARLRSHG